MSRLRQRVDTCIRASGAVYPRRLSRDRRERGLEPILNRVAVCLTLPAGEGRAVVRDGESQPVRHLFRRHQVGGVIARGRALHAIQITLQDHLGRDLVDNAARPPRLLSGIAQRAMGGSGR
jgi:hypothetical protein